MFNKATRTLLLIAGVAGLLSSAPSFAENISATINVNSAGVQSTLPTIQARASEDLLLDVNNNLATTVFLEVPDLGIRYPVEAVSDQTFFFDLAQMPSDNVAFLVRDANGNILSNGQIAINDLEAVEMASLDSIINYSTAYEAEAKPQPVYYDRGRTESRQFIRGYW
jgi:hypothetical protein